LSSKSVLLKFELDYSRNKQFEMIILDRTKLVEIFIGCDDFQKNLKSYLEAHSIGEPETNFGPKPKMSDSEIMAILTFFHLSGMRCFKWYYQHKYLTKINYKFFSNVFDYIIYLISKSFIIQIGIRREPFILYFSPKDLNVI